MVKRGKHCSSSICFSWCLKKL